MQLPSKWKERLQQGAYEAQWAWLYSGDAAAQRERHLAALAEFTETFGIAKRYALSLRRAARSCAAIIRTIRTAIF